MHVTHATGNACWFRCFSPHGVLRAQVRIGDGERWQIEVRWMRGPRGLRGPCADELSKQECDMLSASPLCFFFTSSSRPSRAEASPWVPGALSPAYSQLLVLLMQDGTARPCFPSVWAALLMNKLINQFTARLVIASPRKGLPRPGARLGPISPPPFSRTLAQLTQRCYACPAPLTHPLP